MNTTTAATQASVTVATIRTWCRIGAVAATKRAGRWIIEAASLAHRIDIGQRKARMTSQPKYRIEEATVTQYRKERTVYRVVRIDGTPAGYGPGKDDRILDAEFFTTESAEFYRDFYEHTSNGYRVEHISPRSSQIGGSPQWLLTGSTSDDPGAIRRTLQTSWTNKGGWPEGTRQVDVLIAWANAHAAGRDQRIQAKAEQDIIDEAETAVREVREQQLAAARQRKGTLATPRQVEYIMQLLMAREGSGEEGGMVTGYPTDRAGIEELSKGEASLYIDSLKSNY